MAPCLQPMKMNMNDLGRNCLKILTASTPASLLMIPF